MKTLIVAALSTLIAGCAIAPDQPREPYEQKVYRTGSNIPAKDTGAKSGDAQSIQLPPNTQLPRGAGGG